MTVSPALEAEILRCYCVESYRVGRISKKFHLHPGTISRILFQAKTPIVGLISRSKIEPYLEFIRETLEKIPTIPASRLYVMVTKRGYVGGLDHFRHLISRFCRISAKALSVGLF